MSYERLSEEEERVGASIIDAAIKVHRELGPGLLEHVYEVCLCHELTRHGLKWRRQVSLPIVYDGLVIEDAYRLDVLVEDLVVVEIKAVEEMKDVHVAQCVTQLRFARKRLGYVLNFNVPLMRKGWTAPLLPDTDESQFLLTAASD